MVILFRKPLGGEEEFRIASKYFLVKEQRSEIMDLMKNSGEKVMFRYSLLPFPRELHNDILYFGLKPVNYFWEHEFVADIRNWYPVLGEHTPHTWMNLESCLDDKTYKGPYVLKGYTNSRKDLWLTHMFAEDRGELRNVYCRLLDDSLIGGQGICIRKFESFKLFGKDIQNMPVSKEFRFFIYMKKIVGGGFYWQNHVGNGVVPSPYEVPRDFLNKIIDLVSPYISFWVVDVAQHEDGRWRVVELNDGNMSGLSCIDADELYKNIQTVEYSLSC